MALAASLPARAATAPPLDTLLTGTAADAVAASTIGDTTSYCLLNFTLPPGTQAFADIGPAVSFYQQDTATGPITLAFPGIGHGTQVQGQAPAWDYFAVGTGQLVFNGPDSGAIGFLTGGVWVPNGSITPQFSQFSASWNPANSQLTLSLLITLGNCAVPFSAVYSD